MTRLHVLFSLLLALSVSELSAQGYRIDTFAGGYPLGDDGLAATAALSSPDSMTIDFGGNLYVCDTLANRIRKITPAGVITTLAGDGMPGFSGDGGTAALARVNGPHGIAVNAAGEVYFADTYNLRIRKISPAGMITTVAGTGTYGATGDGGPAALATLNQPAGVSLDGAGNVYVADTGNNRIRKISPSGTITAFAGTGTAGYSGDGGPALSARFDTPHGIYAKTDGTLLICDLMNHVVRQILPSGTVTTVAGNGNMAIAGDGGAAGVASLIGPYEVTLDQAGNMYITDPFGERVRRVSPAGIISTFAGNSETVFVTGDGGPATAAKLYMPRGVAAGTDGSVYVSEDLAHVIRRVVSGVITTFAGISSRVGDGGPATGARLVRPQGVFAGPAGDLVIADTLGSFVRRVNSQGIVSIIGGTGRSCTLVSSPVLGCTSPRPDGPASSSNLEPHGVSEDSAGNVYLVDEVNGAPEYACKVRRISPDGNITTLTTRTNSVLTGLTRAATGTLYAIDYSRHQVVGITTDGTVSTVAGDGAARFAGDGGLAVRASLNYPQGVAIASDGSLLIADTNNHRIRRVAADGTISTVAGNGTYGFSGDGGLATDATLAYPYSVASDSAGNLYIADWLNGRVRAVNAARIITTIAGNGGFSFSGDGGSALGASLAGPNIITVDTVGRVYVGNLYVDRIRVLTPCGVALDSTAAAPTAAAFSGSIGVTAEPSCGWSSFSTASWIKVTSAGTRAGSGAVIYTVSANPGAARTGAILIAGHTFTITQAVAPAGPALGTGAAAVNGASFLPGISPGAWVTIRGTNLADIAVGRIWRGDEIINGQLPLSLDNVSVKINNKPAALYYVSATQLNVQAPDDTTVGNVTVEVTTQWGKASGTASLSPLSPGLFVGPRSGTRLYVAAVMALPDASGNAIYVGIPELLAGVRAQAAKPGDLISLYGTGFGATNPPRPAGWVIDPAPLQQSVAVTLGGVKAEVSYGGLSAPGLNQINIRVPDLPDGDYAITATVDGQSTQPDMYLTIQR